MALFIGKADLYYTLWDVTITLTNTSIVTDYQYKQNLSFDETKAIEKAKEMGCKNLDIDETLRGKNSSFETETPNYCKLNTETLGFIDSKKYGRVIINETNNLDYLLWFYFNRDRNIHVEKRLIEADLIRLVDGLGYIRTDEFDEFMLNESIIVDIKTKGECIIKFDSNLRNEYDLYAYYKVSSYDIAFSEFVTNYYNGFPYCLPMNPKTKKGTRIKGKRVKLTFKNTVDIDGIFYVDKFEVLKD